MKNSRLAPEVNLLALIADLKQVDYKNTLLLTALIELLVEKRVIDRNELLSKARHLDSELEREIEQQRTSAAHRTFPQGTAAGTNHDMPEEIPQQEL